MRIVLGTHHLIARAGSDTYLVTVAKELQRLGHVVTIHAVEQGEMAARARADGLDVAASESELPPDADGVIVQDEVAALLAAARYPDVPRVFVCHSDVFAIDSPPQVPGAVTAVVAMSDRVLRHLAAAGVEAETVRLRQPIDLERFRPSGDARPRARNLVAIGNYLRGERRAALHEVAREVGLEVRSFGGEDAVTEHPEEEMAWADVVVGKSRVVLEAMACGRAAYLYDFLGADGWVTPESYPAMEADAFLGQATDAPVDRARLRRELTEYRVDMGMANHDLAVTHHAAPDHARALVELLERLREERAAVALDLPVRAMARMAQRAWLAESALIDERRRVDRMTGELRREVDRADAAERLAREAAAAVETIKSSRRYRMAERMARPLDRLRRR